MAGPALVTAPEGAEMIASLSWRRGTRSSGTQLQALEALGLAPGDDWVRRNRGAIPRVQKKTGNQNEEQTGHKVGEQLKAGEGAEPPWRAQALTVVYRVQRSF